MNGASRAVCEPGSAHNRRKSPAMKRKNLHAPAAFGSGDDPSESGGALASALLDARAVKPIVSLKQAG